MSTIEKGNSLRSEISLIFYIIQFHVYLNHNRIFVLNPEQIKRPNIHYFFNFFNYCFSNFLNS